MSNIPTIAALSVILLPWGILWLLLLDRYRERGAILPTEPRRLVPWNGFPHVALAFFIYIALQWLWANLIRHSFDLGVDDSLVDMPEVFTWLLAGNAVLILLSIGLIFTFLRIDLRATLADLGVQFGKIKSDIALGLVAFLAAAPLVYILQFILKQAYEIVVEEKAAHPIEKMMLDNPSTGVLFWAFCTAVIAAPLVEEFLFRVILQGWLEKAFIRTKRFAAAQAAGEEVTEEQLTSQSPDTTFMWQPIVLSSITFALPHAGHGPDPVPLFFLAMVLGYLYAKTHRILPGIVVHMALNGTSMLILMTGL